jgi:hypothetical protein
MGRSFSCAWRLAKRLADGDFKFVFELGNAARKRARAGRLGRRARSRSAGCDAEGYDGRAVSRDHQKKNALLGLGAAVFAGVSGSADAAVVDRNHLHRTGIFGHFGDDFATPGEVCF